MTRAVQVAGYALLAALLGIVFHYLKSPNESWALSLWFGVCMVGGAVAGAWLRRRLRKSRLRPTN